MKKLILIVTAFFSLACFGNELIIEKNNLRKERVIDSKVDYSIWEMMLKVYIDDKGNVDYAKFKKNEKIFNNFLSELTNTRIDNSWIDSEKISFWINVYNAYTIKLILDNYPVKSIKEIKKPWTKKFFMVNGEYLSLGDVEHQILRKQFNEPRIHFAINCASKSCPRIVQIPYTAKNLDKLLERQTKEYINDPTLNNVNYNSYQLSKLFSWFSKDFRGAEGSVKNFINKYSEIAIRTQKNNGFKEYNWELNTK